MLCACGCGQTAPLATVTRQKTGQVKGEPLKFRRGHNRRKKAPGQTLAKMVKSHAPGEGWTDAEREVCLLILARHDGNARRAARELKQQGIPVSENTLASWRRDNYPQEYQRIRAEVLPVLQEETAELYADVATRSAQVAGEMLARLAREHGEISASQLSAKIKDLSFVTGIHRDHAYKARGQPTEIVRRESVSEILRSLERFGYKPDEPPIVEAEVVEVEDGTPISDRGGGRNGGE